MTTPAPVTEINPTTAAAQAAAGSALLIDVREDDEWAAGHHPDATHIPLDTLDPANVPTGRPVITVCRSGGRSAKAAKKLADAGLQVSNLTGGMNAVAAAGLPVITPDGTPGTVI